MNEYECAKYNSAPHDARVRELFEFLPDPHLMTDSALVVHEANAAACELLATPAASLCGRPLAAWIENDQRDRFTDAASSLATKSDFSLDVHLRTRAGRSVRAVLAAKTRPNRAEIVWTARPLSGLLRANRDKDDLLARERQIRKQLEAGHRAKDRLLAILARDLRSPLNAVLGWTHLLQNEVLDKSARDKALSRIERNVRLQVDLIDGMLDISRIASHDVQLDIRPVDLTGLVGRIVGATNERAIELGVSLSLYAAESLVVFGDAARLEHVVDTLLMTALSSVASGGSIGVTLFRTESSIVLRVMEDGQGMPTSLVPHAFDCREGAGDMAASAGERSLRLFVVRNLVELHGGSIRADKLAGDSASMFTVTLPCRNATLAKGTVISTFDRTLADVCVLLVDDDHDACDLVALMLRRCGAKVTIASHVASVAESLARTRIDVILCAIGAADGEGTELLASLRAHHPHDTPAIGLGIENTEAAVLASIEAGFDAYLVRPVVVDDLLAAVKRVLAPRP